MWKRSESMSRLLCQGQTQMSPQSCDIEIWKELCRINTKKKKTRPISFILNMFYSYGYFWNLWLFSTYIKGAKMYLNSSFQSTLKFTYYWSSLLGLWSLKSSRIAIVFVSFHRCTNPWFSSMPVSSLYIQFLVSYHEHLFYNKSFRYCESMSKQDNYDTLA